MAFHTAGHWLWGKFHSHVFSDERTLGAQPWRTEGLCPWWALITLAWRPTSDQIKMLQVHHEQGNLQCSCLVQRQLSCCLPSSPHFIISHTTSLHLAQPQLIRQPHTFRVLQEALQRPGLLQLPPCAAFISPSVHSSLSHIPFSKLQLCFLIRQFRLPSHSLFSDLAWLCPDPDMSPLPTLTALSTLSLLCPLLLGDAHHRLKWGWGALDGLPQVMPDLAVCLN